MEYDSQIIKKKLHLWMGKGKPKDIESLPEKNFS